MIEGLTDPMNGPPASAASNASDAARLKHEYSEIATLAGGLAHEIRNPLSTIRMNIDLLFEDAVESEDPKTRRMLRKLETIRRECSNLEGLLNAFLQFARAGEMQTTRCDLSRIVAEFIEFYRPEADKYGIELQPHLAADLPPVDVDENQIRQLLMNLTRNAQQAMPQQPEGRGEVRSAVTNDGAAGSGKGTIAYQTYCRDGQVILEIIDTGVGIPPAAREKLFQVFFSTKATGTGLGLPTVRKIVEAHRGTVQCDSEPGKGTRFTISLPCAPSP